MLNYIKYFFIAAALFSLIDFVWLTLVAKKFYAEQLGSLLKAKPNLPAAVIFYLLFIVGLLVFAVVPASHNSHPVTNALILGSLYGLFTYATYDLTNLATLKGWPFRLVSVDIAWGVFLSGAVAALTALIGF